jgi:hypothetical protein
MLREELHKLLEKMLRRGRFMKKLELEDPFMQCSGAGTGTAGIVSF